MKLSELELPSDIDILKVDAEGHDFSVIQSLDWSSTNPHVVICEYDDQKLQVGESDSWAPLVEFLESKGFIILISEWYPIEKYGGNHKWRRMHVESRPSPGSWGNIIAIKEKALNYSRVLSAVLSSVTYKGITKDELTSELTDTNESKNKSGVFKFFLNGYKLFQRRAPRVHNWLLRSWFIRKRLMEVRNWLERL